MALCQPGEDIEPELEKGESGMVQTITPCSDTLPEHLQGLWEGSAKTPTEEQQRLARHLFWKNQTVSVHSKNDLDQHRITAESAVLNMGNTYIRMKVGCNILTDTYFKSW